LFVNLQIQYDSLDFWLIITGAVLLGIIVGWILAKVKSIPPMIIGGFGGYLGGLFLYTLMLNYIHSNPAVVYWCTVILSAAGGVVLAYFFYKHVFILGTAFIGGYAFIRGISFWAGGYPDERQLIDLIENEEWAQVDALMTYKVYLYLISMLIVAVAGAIVQYKYFYDGEDDKEKEDREKNKEDKEAFVKK